MCSLSRKSTHNTCIIAICTRGAMKATMRKSVYQCIVSFRLDCGDDSMEANAATLRAICLKAWGHFPSELKCLKRLPWSGGHRNIVELFINGCLNVGRFPPPAASLPQRTHNVYTLPSYSPLTFWWIPEVGLHTTRPAGRLCWYNTWKNSPLQCGQKLGSQTVCKYDKTDVGINPWKLRRGSVMVSCLADVQCTHETLIITLMRTVNKKM